MIASIIASTQAEGSEEHTNWVEVFQKHLFSWLHKEVSGKLLKYSLQGKQKHPAAMV